VSSVAELRSRCQNPNVYGACRVKAVGRACIARSSTSATATRRLIVKVMLRVRDLKTGIFDDQEFPSLEAARAWLVDRPRFEQVLGVPTEGIPVEVNQELKKICRPLDEEEKAAAESWEEAERNKRALKLAEQERERAKERAADEAEMAKADPKRLMKVRWTYDHGFANGGDDREVPDVVKEAVLAWVAERNEWVEGRGQMVGDATVMAWPADVPAGEERIAYGGTFIPVTQSE
jgi:hypothetical protein